MRIALSIITSLLLLTFSLPQAVSSSPLLWLEIKAVQAHPKLDVMFDDETECADALHTLKTQFRQRVIAKQEWGDHIVYTLIERYGRRQTTIAVCGIPDKPKPGFSEIIGTPAALQRLEVQAIQAYPDEIVFEGETECGKALHMLRARYRHKISHTEKFLDSLVYTLEQHRFFRPTRTAVLVCGPPL